MDAKDYKEKYEHGIECIQEILSGAGDSIKTSILRKRLQPFFPELKESEDERMRKEIIDFLRLPHPQFVGKRDHEEWIAWLEKQGEKTTVIDIDKMVMEYSQTKDGDFGLPVNCMLRAYRKGINDALSIALNIEKQGEKEPTEDAKKLDADKVIAWLVANICDFEYYVKLFKKDFGLTEKGDEQ